MTEQITVVRWTGRHENLTASLGGMGGWFCLGYRWDDYIKNESEQFRQYAEALRAEIVRRELKRGGDWHQGPEGSPVFSDGTCADFSFRAWGDFSAAVWSSEEDKDYSYMDFYMEGFGHVLRKSDAK